MISTVPHGERIPKKTWLRCTDILAEYCRAGELFVKEGKPDSGETAERFKASEKEYNQMADAIWFAKWEKSQREEWTLIWKLR